MSKKYDVIIIGAGMSGLGAGIRLAMYGKKVCILEKHFISGGLNSYYKRGKREFDVGLHAMTNYVPKGSKRKPLTKLLKQLRVPYDELMLCEQKRSVIHFPENKLYFTNDFEYLRSQISESFPSEIDNFNNFVTYITSFNEVSLDNETYMAKDVAKKYIKDDQLIEMIFCPLLIYGSAWENDMDFSQFVIMFKSIYLEGFSRPKGGVRTIIDILLKKYEEVGGELLFKSEVKEVVTKDKKVTGVVLSDGSFLETKKVISSMGHPETARVTTDYPNASSIPIGPLSFCETIACMDKLPKDIDINDTIVFYNNSSKYHYKKPETLYDPRSAVICFPNNFENDVLEEGIARVTFMANYDLWSQKRSEDLKEYRKLKKELLTNSLKTIQNIYPQFSRESKFDDVFTPATITRYTSHIGGTVYGSTHKLRDGKTPIDGLYLCGTDQGFLGIVGSMLSGISIANLYGLMND